MKKDGSCDTSIVEAVVKDINDMVQSSIRDARLIEIINTNTYSGQRGEWEVQSWKKV